jgi:hypothetical protein
MSIQGDIGEAPRVLPGSQQAQEELWRVQG